MIYFWTGAPGANKTSNALWAFLYDKELNYIKTDDMPEDAPKIPRQRYAIDIKGFDYEKHNVIKITLEDLEKWDELPDGGFFFIDEADQFFPNGSIKSPPDYIRKLARHRHRGFDFFIITQQPNMIHPFIHGLVECHYHFQKAYGKESSLRYKWESFQASPNILTTKNRAVVETVTPNPEVFTLYKSATINTRVKDVPYHLYIKMAALCSLVLFAFVFVYWFLSARHLPKQQTTQPVKQEQTTKQPQAIAQQPQQSNGSLSSINQPLAPKDFVATNSAAPWSAPAYADLTKPTDFPRVAACIKGKSNTNPDFNGCKCFTQQATPVDVPEPYCSQIVKNGSFDPWKTGRAQQENVLTGKPEESTARQEIAALNNQQKNITKNDEIR